MKRNPKWNRDPLHHRILRFAAKISEKARPHGLLHAWLHRGVEALDEFQYLAGFYGETWHKAWRKRSGRDRRAKP